MPRGALYPWLEGDNRGCGGSQLTAKLTLPSSPVLEESIAQVESEGNPLGLNSDMDPRGLLLTLGVGVRVTLMISLVLSVDVDAAPGPRIHGRQVMGDVDAGPWNLA